METYQINDHIADVEDNCASIDSSIPHIADVENKPLPPVLCFPLLDANTTDCALGSLASLSERACPLADTSFLDHHVQPTTSDGCVTIDSSFVTAICEC